MRAGQLISPLHQKADMTDFFRKPLSEIDADDIRGLIEDDYPEGYRLEYKRQLSEKGDGTPDNWYQNGKLGDRARDGLLREMVAFANAFGGYLVLGVAEDPDKPEHPGNIEPVPRCAELANRLMQQARSCIDPTIPLVDARGIPTEDGDSGVLVIHVERSHLAPHRLNSDKECYTRRNDRSEPMAMREIQDLTLRVAQSATRIDDLFSSRSEEFRKVISAGVNTGFRASFSPLWFLGEVRVHNNEALFPTLQNTNALSGENHIEIQIPCSAWEQRPIVRGSRRYGENNKSSLLQIMADRGWGEIQYVKEEELPYSLFPGWILFGLYNALRMISAYREGIGSPASEYVLEWEICCAQGEVTIGRWNPHTHSILGKTDPQTFPRLSVGDPSEFDALLHRAYEDLLHALGETVRPDDPPFVYEFS